MFAAFDMAKAEFGNANVKVTTKMPVRSVEINGEAGFEQGEYELIGHFKGACTGFTFPENIKK